LIPLSLTLTLFMARIRADNMHNALAADNPAVFAHTANGTTNFHDRPLAVFKVSFNYLKK